jgi:hypothetical protein
MERVGERREMADIEEHRPTPLGRLAAEINAEHRAFVGTFRKTVEHGIRAGELLSEAKEQCPHRTWLDWLATHFEGAPRTAQEYMRLYNRRAELRAKTRDSAHLSVSGALKELAKPERPEAIPPEEWAIVKHATESNFVVVPDLERLAEIPDGARRGYVAQAAWMAMLEQGREYSFLREQVHEGTGPTEDLDVVDPDLLTKLQLATENLRWWVAQSEWIESIVRACDWPPGRGMPDEAFDEEKKNLPLDRLYNADKGLPSPRERIREFCGPVV